MSSNWRVYHGRSRLDRQPQPADAPPADPPSPLRPDHPLAQLPPPPPWRRFGQVDRDALQGQVFQPDDQLIDVVNMALYLRRPLLLTGKPGSGKSSLARALAEELRLGLLKWSITTRSTLQDGLYTYDVIRRLQDAQIYQGAAPGAGAAAPPDPVRDIGRYIKLGPLGTAMLPGDVPAVLLIDEIDKSDIDLPNDLLNILEEGEFEIPEVKRHYDLAPQPVFVTTADGRQAEIGNDGRVRCEVFPIIIMTSNGERDFPPAFLRRCLRYRIRQPDQDELERIVAAHLGQSLARQQIERIAAFVERRRLANDNLATDQLLNVIYLLSRGSELDDAQVEQVLNTLLQSLEEGA